MNISPDQDSYKCLSIAQPFAWAIAQAGKRIENRTFATTHRGTMLIQASRSGEWMRGGIDTLHGLRACGELRRHGSGEPLKVPAEQELEYGVVVAVCRVADCVSPTVAAAKWPHQRVWIAGHARNLCWVLEDVCPFLTPVPLLGKQGIFEVEPNEFMRRELRRAIEAARGKREEPVAGAGLFPMTGRMV